MGQRRKLFFVCLVFPLALSSQKKEPNTLPRRSARAVPPRALRPAEGLPGTGIMRLVPGRRRPWWRWCEKRGGQRRLKGEKKKEENCEEEVEERAKKKKSFSSTSTSFACSLARSLFLSFFLSFSGSKVDSFLFLSAVRDAADQPRRAVHFPN